MNPISNPPTSENGMLAIRRCITTLAALPEAPSQVISGYFDLRQPRLDLISAFRLWAAGARGTLVREQRESFDSSVMEVLAALDRARPESQGLAVFRRSGSNPFSLEQSFTTPIEVHFEVSRYPAIFPLIQMKDRFHRFVLVICGEDHVRIIEMTLGAVSQEIVSQRSITHARPGLQSSREHVHQRRQDDHQQFIGEQVRIVDNLMARRGLNHLLLAGHPRHISAFRDQLPSHVRARLAVSIFQVPNPLDPASLLDVALEKFIQYEQQESRNTVQRLHDQIRRRGLAVVGIHPCRRALEAGAAAELVIAEELHTADREELVRLAAARDLPIEVCEGDELLLEHGGVGCLLRQRFD